MSPVASVGISLSFFLRNVLGGPGDLLQSPNLPLGVAPDGGCQGKFLQKALCYIKHHKRRRGGMIYSWFSNGFFKVYCCCCCCFRSCWGERNLNHILFMMLKRLIIVKRKSNGGLCWDFVRKNSGWCSPLLKMESLKSSSALVPITQNTHNHYFFW